MEAQYYKVHITETGRNKLTYGPKPDEIFNEFSEEFMTLESVKEFIIIRYGKLPGMERKMYTDDVNGERMEIGFLHSYWNKDISHDSKSWYQTDWVTITSITEHLVLLTA